MTAIWSDALNPSTLRWTIITQSLKNVHALNRRFWFSFLFGCLRRPVQVKKPNFPASRKVWKIYPKNSWCSATQISQNWMRACPFCQCSVYRTKSFVGNLQNSLRLKNEGPPFQRVSCMVVKYALGLKIRQCSAKHKSLVKLIIHQPLKWQFWHRFYTR